MKRRSKGTSTTIRLVGGKGGVGKTTLAAAWGAAAAARGARTLVISTDPAPSLGDALGVTLSGVPRPVPIRRDRFDKLRSGVLHAVEVNSRKAFGRWLKERAPALEAIAVRGTWLDESDVQLLLGLSLPGIDELASLLEILRYVRSGRYDTIVIDTAPTGHTLRMLSMPETLAGVARVFDHMQAKHHAIVEALRGARIEDETDSAINGLQHDAAALRALLRDPRLTSVVLVTLPEPMSVAETLDAVSSLDEAGIPLAEIVVNRLTRAPRGSCAWCRARRKQEQRAVSALVSGLVGLRRGRSNVPRISRVEMADREPIGVPALTTLARELDRPPGAARSRGSSTRIRPQAASVAGGVACGFEEAPVRLLMFGGKGGVGKTTCAAAAALTIARRNPGRKVLLVSTDPAHSLSDVLGARVDDSARQISGGPPNLDARELDASLAFAAFREDYRAAIDRVFDPLSAGSPIDASHDRRVLHDLLELAPPGLDEIAAVLGVIELLSPGAYDTLIVDTAPTGHALRLLETPATVQEWTKALMAIVLKYQTVIGVGELGATLLRLSRRLGSLRALLASARETHFVIVTRAAALPAAETLRLLKSLRRLRVHVSSIVVNATGAGTCPRCRRTSRRERALITGLVPVLRRHARDAPVVLAPAIVPTPVGIPTLEKWFDAWRCAGRSASSGLGYHRQAST